MAGQFFHYIKTCIVDKLFHLFANAAPLRFMVDQVDRQIQRVFGDL